VPPTRRPEGRDDPDDRADPTRRGPRAVISVSTTKLTDEELLARLRELLAEVDPMTPVLLEQARLALGWRTLDAELAELSYDSLADREMAAAVRDGGSAGPRLLGFECEVAADGESMLTVDVEVTVERGRACLLGQIMPAAPAVVSVLSSARPSAAVEVTADELGRFRVEPVPSGPVRLRVRAGGRTVDTSWVSYAGLPRAS
jgi:hypothetical protein